MENVRHNYGTIHQKVDYYTNIFLHPGSEINAIDSWKEKLHSILQGISDKTEQLKPLIQFLVTAISPAKIYMLKQAGSDDNQTIPYIDLLIVMSGKSGIPFPELEPLLNIACAGHSQVVCSLHNEGSVLEGLRAGHIFYTLHCTADNLVYDDKVLEYPAAIPETLSVIRQKAAETFYRYFQKAQDFYSSAVMLRKDGYSPLIMFMLHQSVECIYRGSLQSFTGYDKKTHEIRVLMKQVRHHSRQLNIAFTDSIPENKRLMQLLDKAYIDARYEKEYSIEEKDLEMIFDKITLLHVLTKDVAKAILIDTK